mmetsp:Transcript_6901/g.16911  ORF Transcript_6901/g.16911 Transcript_6901/m.16911 type:complete len:217 (-) Transcript_6901:275-925(-)
MVKLGRWVSFHLFASVLGTTIFFPWECECFSSPAFVNNRRFLQYIDTMSLSCTKDRGRTMKNGDDDNRNDETVPDDKSLIGLLSPNSSCRVNQMSGTDLAYIGDVVFELFIRSRHVWPSKRTSDLQNTVVSLVRAEHQSYILQKLKKSFPLSEKENQVLMRGRNAVTKSKNRRNPVAYQDSTALEALVGYLYINDKTRCEELLSWLETVVDIREGT